MLTISDRVKSWIQYHPFHATFIAQGLVNASALARIIKPDIQKQIGEDISVDAVTLALNRQVKHLQTSSIDFEQFLGEVSVQSGLSLISLPQVDLNPDTFSKAIAILHKSHEYTLYSRGVWHTILIGKRSVIDELTTHFYYSIIAHDLVAVTVKLQPGHLATPGVCAYILQKIAFRGINLQEVSSSHNELTLIIHKDDMNKTLECLV